MVAHAIVKRDALHPARCIPHVAVGSRQHLHRPAVPPNEFVGPNAPYGAIVTYYLAAKRQERDARNLDARGNVVRNMENKDVPKRVGLNRASWDLRENGPAKWTGTFKGNEGPDEGAEVVPGAYAVRLTVAGIATTQPLTVKADPARSRGVTLPGTLRLFDDALSRSGDDRYDARSDRHAFKAATPSASRRARYVPATADLRSTQYRRPQRIRRHCASTCSTSSAGCDRRFRRRRRCSAKRAQNTRQRSSASAPSTEALTGAASTREYRSMVVGK